MSASLYKIIHLLGVLMVFLSLGGVLLHAINGGSKEYSWRKQIGMTHGIGLLLALLGGFGMMAKLNYSYTDGWFLIKVVIWLSLGAMLSLAAKKPEQGKLFWMLTLILGLLAAYLGIEKPF